MVEYRTQYTAPLEMYQYFPLAPPRPVRQVAPEEPAKPKVEERIIPVVQYGPERQPQPETRKFMFPFFGRGFTIVFEEQQPRITPERLLGETARMKAEVEVEPAPSAPPKSLAETILGWELPSFGLVETPFFLPKKETKPLGVAAGFAGFYESIVYKVSTFFGMQAPKPPPTPFDVSGVLPGLGLKEKIMGVTPGGEAVLKTVEAAEPIQVKAPMLSVEETMAFGGPEYFLGTLLGEAALTYGIGKGFEAAQKRATEWLTKQYVEKGPLAWRGRLEKFVSGITGAEPQLARGEISIPTPPLKPPTKVEGVFTIPTETLKAYEAYDVMWAATIAPRQSGIMITKYATAVSELQKSLPHLFARGGELAKGWLKETMGFKKPEEVAKQLPFEQIQPVGGFEKTPYRFPSAGEFWFEKARLPTLTELATQQKVLPFATQTQLTRMGVHPYIPALATLPSGIAFLKTSVLIGAGLAALPKLALPTVTVEPAVPVEPEKARREVKVIVGVEPIEPVKARREARRRVVVTPETRVEWTPTPAQVKRETTRAGLWAFTFPAIDLGSILGTREISLPAISPAVSTKQVAVQTVAQQLIQPSKAVGYTVTVHAPTITPRKKGVPELLKPSKRKRRTRKIVIRYGRYKRAAPVATPQEFLEMMF